MPPRRRKYKKATHVQNVGSDDAQFLAAAEDRAAELLKNPTTVSKEFEAVGEQVSSEYERLKRGIQLLNENQMAQFTLTKQDLKGCSQLEQDVAMINIICATATQQIQLLRHHLVEASTVLGAATQHSIQDQLALSLCLIYSMHN